jgi:hypothetical protein
MAGRGRAVMIMIPRGAAAGPTAAGGAAGDDGGHHGRGRAAMVRGCGRRAGREPAGRGVAARRAATGHHAGVGGHGRGRGRIMMVRGGPVGHGGQGRHHPDGRGAGDHGRGAAAENAGRCRGGTQPPPPQVSEADILRVGLEYAGFPDRRQRVRGETKDRRFREHYGIGAKACAALLNAIRATEPRLSLKEFFMGVNFLKVYDTEGVMAGDWDYDEKTIRVKVRKLTNSIAGLKDQKIVFGDFEDDEIFWISIDGVHCCIYEPRRDPSSKWFSHKSNGAGLTYELGIAIRSNRLVWIRGPFPASQHDMTTFRGGKKNEAKDETALFFQIPDGKRAVGDSGYRGEPGKVSVTRNGDSGEVKNFKGRVKSRHETFNGRLKAFKILSTRFRHRLGPDLSEHKAAFEAVCVACQFDLENDHGLFEV